VFGSGVTATSLELSHRRETDTSGPGQRGHPRGATASGGDPHAGECRRIESDLTPLERPPGSEVAGDDSSQLMTTVSANEV